MRTHSDRDVRMMVARSSVGEHHVPLDLAGANLEMANLPHVDLSGANLAGANLRGAMLWGARLDGARLDGTDLTCANLTWCSLLHCSTQETLMVEADLDEATVGDLSQAITTGADMVTVMYFLDALKARMRALGEAPEEARSARGAPEDVGRAAKEREEREARGQALLIAVEKNAPPALRRRGKAGFGHKHEELERAKARVLSDSDIQELLRFSREERKPLNLRGCNLSGADLRDAPLDGACLRFANLTGADTRGASFVGADMQDVYGMSTGEMALRDVDIRRSGFGRRRR
jgi:uncharacterized protein YjbI with pentapeptide repeats